MSTLVYLHILVSSYINFPGGAISESEVGDVSSSNLESTVNAFLSFYLLYPVASFSVKEQVSARRVSCCGIPFS